MGFDDQSSEDNAAWEFGAWVYFIWIVLGFQVYCQIGYSTNPSTRYNQLLTGIPERPYRIHLLTCTSVEQAKLFERMFHEHLRDCNSRGEWFTHVNAEHLHKLLHGKMREIFSLFHSLGQQAVLELIGLGRDRPVLRSNDLVSHVVACTR